jgi:hypothetical protein
MMEIFEMSEPKRHDPDGGESDEWQSGYRVIRITLRPNESTGPLVVAMDDENKRVPTVPRCLREVSGRG